MASYLQRLIAVATQQGDDATAHHLAHVMSKADLIELMDRHITSVEDRCERYRMQLSVMNPNLLSVVGLPRRDVTDRRVASVPFNHAERRKGERRAT